MAQPIPINDIERYTRGLYLCEAEARVAGSREFQQLWNTVAGSYRFLLDRENRSAAEQAVKNPDAPA
jgi:hypothetical protein